MASPPPWSEELLGLVITGLHAPCRSWHSAPSPPWSELPQELLGLVLAGLPHPADRARFHSVCRSWYSAPSPPQLSWINPVCRSWYSVSSPQQQSWSHAVCRMLHTANTPSEIPWRRIWRSIFSPRRQPWIVLPDGFFLDNIALEFSDCGPQPTTSFPENLRCVGSTDSWLALDYMDDEKRHNYLHNPFCKTTVPLPKLDAVIGNVSEFFKIRKVLMRSTPDDLISVMTNNWSYPIILIQPKKGVWLPKPQTPPLASIIDVAFIGDRLYGITMDEDLVSLHITFDVHGVPVVTSIEHVIWSNIDDADAPGDDEDENNGEDNEGEQDNDEVLSEEYSELTWNIGDGMIGEGIQCEDDFVILRYLVESHGKLLMVRRELSGAKLNYSKVEVFEANMSAGAWIPMSGGLGGQALFMSNRFSKSVSAHGDVEPDAIYFIDLGEVFSMKPQPINPQGRYIGYFRCSRFLGFDLPMWIFPPN